jgi:hypothetical protein
MVTPETQKLNLRKFATTGLQCREKKLPADRYPNSLKITNAQKQNRPHFSRLMNIKVI